MPILFSLHSIPFFFYHSMWFILISSSVIIDSILLFLIVHYLSLPFLISAFPHFLPSSHIFFLLMFHLFDTLSIVLFYQLITPPSSITSFSLPSSFPLLVPLAILYHLMFVTFQLLYISVLSFHSASLIICIFHSFISIYYHSFRSSFAVYLAVSLFSFSLPPFPLLSSPFSLLPSALTTAWNVHYHGESRALLCLNGIRLSLFDGKEWHHIERLMWWSCVVMRT